MSAHLRAGAVSRTEDASGAAGGCPQSVESAVLRAFENASRTREGCFVHRVPQKTPSVQKRGGSCTEYLFRTGKACFLHRMLPMRRVPQEAFLSTACIFRTIGGPLRYRMPDRGRLPPQRSLANILVDLIFFLEGRGKNSIFASVTIQTQ